MKDDIAYVRYICVFYEVLERVNFLLLRLLI